LILVPDDKRRICCSVALSAALAFVLAIKAPTFVLIAVISLVLYRSTKNVSKY
jgi:hypothetical protein